MNLLLLMNLPKTVISLTWAPGTTLSLNNPWMRSRAQGTPRNYVQNCGVGCFLTAADQRSTVFIKFLSRSTSPAALSKRALGINEPLHTYQNTASQGHLWHRVGKLRLWSQINSYSNPSFVTYKLYECLTFLSIHFLICKIMIIITT